MKPDVIFIISDGSFQWKARGSSGTIPWKDVKKIFTENLCKSGDCKVNFIAFEAKDEDSREMKNISQRSGGKMIELK
jgi:hypothetical protein